jgi:hypothetical protein
LFDPVFIEAEANGCHFKEMHVDGGTSLQVLAIPLKLAAAGRLFAAHHPPGQLYIIINNILEPTFTVTKPKTLSITARAFNTLVKSDFYDTILGSYLFAMKQGLKFNLVHRLICSWHMAAARRVALKMGRRLRCSSVTYRFRYAPSSRLADGPF